MTGSLPARLGALAFATGLLAPATGWTAEGEPFYASKQITFIVGTGAGGGNDVYARVLAQFLPRHIPGMPSMVVQNMPGSEGVTAAGYMYNIAVKDGTVVATTPASTLLAEALNPAQVHFESRKFGWVGTIATTTDLLAVFKSSGIETLDDAKRREVVIGATGQYSLSAMEPAIANALLGTKFRIIKGYSGGEGFNLAMDRHEIEGRTNQWASWKVLRPDWIRNDQLSYLLQYGPKDPGIPGKVPTLDELVTTPGDKAIAALLEVTQYVGRSVFTPPGLPPDRLAVLQKAFDETMADPAFIAKMRELKLELYPRKASETLTSLTRAMTNRDGVVRDMKAKLNLD
jgi:tripartite-type tricarboxylate transporter receptor subunit TctC